MNITREDMKGIPETTSSLSSHLNSMSTKTIFTSKHYMITSLSWIPLWLSWWHCRFWQSECYVAYVEKWGKL